MSWTLRIVTAAALAVCAAAAYADPPGRVARLNYASGAVSFAPGEAPDRWVQAVLNRPLTGGDRLWADRDGYGEFRVGSTAVRMAPLTNIDVLHLDDDRLQLRLAQGNANIRVRALDADDLVEVATPAGAVIIREPGSYRISVDPNADVTRVSVNFGRAEIVTPGPDLTVPSGQAVSVSTHAPAAFEIAAQDEFDRWSAERDRRNDRLVSTRYVSPHMTGYEDLDHYGSWRTVPEYGNVWVPARVAPGWAPYRHGHWAWISPWGWTWIDDAPWGFAPFHYGRWVHVHDHWAWAPGPIVRRPVYAPALVAFVGGPHWSVSVGSGPAVGWFPLGWREPYHPWYRASHTHVRNVNVTHVTNVTNITNVTHVHRHRPEAVTVVSRENFVSARSVERSRVNVARADLARAEVIRERQPAEPVRASLAPERAGPRPPAHAARREVVAVNPPAASEERRGPGLRGDDEANPSARRSDDTPRVRVINREEFASRRAERAARREATATAPAGAAIARPAAATAPGVTATPAGATAPGVAASRAAAASAPAVVQAAPAAAQPRDAEREQRERAEERDRRQAERRARAEGDQRNRAATTDERPGPAAERAAQAEANQRGENRARIEAERQAARAQAEQQRAQAEQQRAQAEQRARAQQAQVQRAPAPSATPPAPPAPSATPPAPNAAPPAQRAARPAPSAAPPAPPAARDAHAARPQAATPAPAQRAPRAQQPAPQQRGDDSDRRGPGRRGEPG